MARASPSIFRWRGGAARGYHRPMDRDEALRAYMERDPAYEGRLFAGVTSTGIFCRPSCPSRRPDPSRLQFYAEAREALAAGFRPCLRCRPLEGPADPPWLAGLLSAVESEPDRRLTDSGLRSLGMDPVAVRRFFKRAYGITFLAYCRLRRLSRAFSAIRSGVGIDEAYLSSGWESASAFREAFKARYGASPGSARAGGESGRRVAEDTGPIVLGWIDTPLGPMVAGAADDALCLLEFTERRMLEAQLETLRRRFRRSLQPGESPAIETIREELGEYFRGERREFSLRLSAPGTPFQESVWAALRTIPYGKILSYAALAEGMGEGGAARAVGHANGLNRIAILIPCHRVVEAGGGLGGYGGGLWRKLRLLELEGSR
jgi:AraC family transcriptional regulator of adaptative response/methylated-DNA-[protein]-cysteine methyltransferase